MRLASKITLNNSQFKRAAAQNRSALGGQVRGLRGLVAPLAAVTAGYLSGRAAVSQFFGALSTAAGAERTRTTFKVLLGDGQKAKELFDDLTEFSDVTPFEPRPVQDAAKFLLASKFEADELRSILTDTGDLASVMGVNLMDVARVMGRLNSGDFGESFERLRDFGISRQDLEGQGLVFDRGGSFKGSIEQAMTAVRTIIQTRFGGTMAEVAQTNIGLMSTLRGAWREVQREFGEPINTELKPVLNDAIELIKGMKDEARQIGENVASGINVINNAFKDGREMDLLKAGLEVAAAGFGNLLLNGMATAANTFGAIFGASFESDIFPALMKGVEGLGSGFAAALTNAIPGFFLKAQRAVAGPGVAEVVRKDLKNQGLIEGSFTNRSLTDKGRAAAAEMGLDLTDLGIFENAVTKFEQAMTDQELDRLFDKGTIVAEQTEQAAKKLSEAGVMMANGIARSAADVSEFMAENKSNEDFFGFNKAQANFKKTAASLNHPQFFDPEKFFGATLVGNIWDGLDPASAYGGGLLAFKNKLLGDPSKVSTGTGGQAGPGNIAASLRDIATDRLARIGGFVGNVGPSTDHARRTADNTKKTASLLEKANEKLTRLAERTTNPNAAAWT